MTPDEKARFREEFEAAVHDQEPVEESERDEWRRMVHYVSLSHAVVDHGPRRAAPLASDRPAPLIRPARRSPAG